jgi:branched-chain amino acid aminotransferase
VTALAVSIDGELVAPERATISVFDPGFLHGDGLFEVLRTWGGATPTLDAHLARLAGSARELALALPEPSVLHAEVTRTIAAAGAGDHRVRLVVTRGGRSIVIVETLPAQPRELAVAVVDWPLPLRTGAAHKVLAFADHLRAKQLAVAVGADEAIRLHADATLAEGATCNVFLVRSREVRTPPAIGILPGITRERVLAHCTELGIAASQCVLTLDDLHTADEVFVTSAVRGVVPVTRVDRRTLCAGPVTARLSRAYLAALDARIVAPA